MLRGIYNLSIKKLCSVCDFSPCSRMREVLTISFCNCNKCQFPIKGPFFHDLVWFVHCIVYDIKFVSTHRVFFHKFPVGIKYHFRIFFDPNLTCCVDFYRAIYFCHLHWATVQRKFFRDPDPMSSKSSRVSTPWSVEFHEKKLMFCQRLFIGVISYYKDIALS